MNEGRRTRGKNEGKERGEEDEGGRSIERRGEGFKERVSGMGKAGVTVVV